MADLAPFRSRRSRIVLLVAVAAAAAAACSDAFKSGHGDTPTPDNDGGVASQPDSSVHVIGPQPGFDGGHAGDDAGEDADVAIDSAVPCTEGTRSCSGGQVVTCLTGGTWGNPVTCGADSPVCSGGMCTAASLDGGAAIPPSCATGGPGMSNCGGDGGVESCCTSLEVPTGTFYRTYTSDPDSGVAMDAGDPATVSGFRLDKYEVTVGRFRQFVNAAFPPAGGTGWTPPAGVGKHAHLNAGKGLVNSTPDAGVAYEPGWISTDSSNVTLTNNNLTVGCDAPRFASWSEVSGSNDMLPITCANWWESYAFCIWDGAFLPSEAEWAYAASGGSQEREYPWGTASPGIQNEYAIYGCDYPGLGNCSNWTGYSTAPVGTPSRGGGRWGHIDLAGNVTERTIDGILVSPDAYTSVCIDCANFTSLRSDSQVRGGNFNSPASLFMSRQGFDANLRGAGLGFRCARTP